jgi:hypothetical protein
MNNDAIVIDMTDLKAREFVHLASLKGACKLEKLGMKRSRGRTALGIAREEFGLKRSAPADLVIQKIEERMNVLSPGSVK